MSTTGVEFLGIGQVAKVDPVVFSDERGFFSESFNAAVFSEQVSSGVEFVQDNHSRSTKAVLRGLHYQLPPKAQGKLVRVVDGAIYDVAVDVRRSSATFGRWVGEGLTSDPLIHLLPLGNNERQPIPISSRSPIRSYPINTE